MEHRPEPLLGKPLLVSHRCAADLLGISQRLLWSLANRGEVPCIRIGRCRRYPVEELRRWVEVRLQRDTSSERGR